MKINIGVFFGGESVEHEISIISAVQTMHAIDDTLYQVIPIYMAKDRLFYTGDALTNIESYKDMKSLLKGLKRVLIVQQDNEVYVEGYPKTMLKNYRERIDVAFPVVHGTNGEDGSLQGMFELLGVPYVGCDVKAAAVGQDKVFMKNILRDAKIPMAPFIWFFKHEYIQNPDGCIEQTKSLSFPMVVKPASLGSSVGITFVKDESELRSGIEQAMRYDQKILVEQAITPLVEINCSVLGDIESATPGVLEQVAASESLLSYEDKYLSNQKGGAQGMASTTRLIPAPLDESKRIEIENLALKTFRVLNSSGVCRIDFLMNQVTKEVYVNEINTIPGSLAFYLWEPKGVDFTELTRRLIALAIKRQQTRESMTFTFDTNVLQSNGLSGQKGKKM